MESSAQQESVLRDGERGALKDSLTVAGSCSPGASCKYESNSSGCTGPARYKVVSQPASSAGPPPAPRSPRFPRPTSHNSRYIGCASETPNRESFLAGNVKSGSAVSAGGSSAPLSPSATPGPS